MSSRIPLIADIVALIPAGGQAKRLQPLSCSKEIYPIGYRQSPEGAKPNPKAVCEYLLESLNAAGINKAYIILRTDKWDIVEFFQDGREFGIHISYLTTQLNNGVPYTLDQAYPFVRNQWVALGFPDIILEPASVFTEVVQTAHQSGADIVLGLFPVVNASKSDVVEMDDDGHVSKVIPKPAETTLEYTWLCALWSPGFTEFIHRHIQSVTDNTVNESAIAPEIYIGDLIQLAIEAGFHVIGRAFERGRYIDIGTPDDLARAQQQYAADSVSD